MKMLRLDHVNVRTSRLAEMIQFYEDVLEIKPGPRPNFDNHGAWLYIGDHPIIHLVEVAQECASHEPKIEHFALQATGLSELTDRLTERGILHTVDKIPDIPLLQVNFEDVDGNHVHIDFNSAELT